MSSSSKWVPKQEKKDNEEDVKEEKKSKKKGKGAQAQASAGGKGGKKGSKESGPEKSVEKGGEKKGKGDKGKGEKAKGEKAKSSEKDSKGKGKKSEGAKSDKTKGGKAVKGSYEEPSSSKPLDIQDWLGSIKSESDATKAKGKSGKGNKSGKSGKSGKGGKANEPSAQSSSTEVKTMQQVEEEILKSIGANVTAKQKQGVKQPLEVSGVSCEVKKHSGMGCAVVTTASPAIREAIMNIVESKGGGLKIDINGVPVQLKRHKDKASGKEILTDIFAAWGHRAEKETPLSTDDIATAFDQLAAQSQQQAPMLLSTAHPNAQPPPLAAPSMSPQEAAILLQQQQQLQLLAYHRQLLYAQQLQAAQLQQAAAAGALPHPYGGAYPPPAQAPVVPQVSKDPGDAPSAAAGSAEFLAKPKTLPIVNPSSGSAIDVLGLNFEPRKPANPWKIVDPKTRDEVQIK